MFDSTAATASVSAKFFASGCEAFLGSLALNRSAVARY